MTTRMAAVRTAFSNFASRDFSVVRTALRIGAKGAFFVFMAFMIVTYAVSVSQSAPPPPEPPAEKLYS